VVPCNIVLTVTTLDLQSRVQASLAGVDTVCVHPCRVTGSNV